MITHTAEIRVRYADTDKMQFVYNGKYLEYFEVGRTELFRSVGFPYKNIESEGYQLPLIEAGLKYISILLQSRAIDSLHFQYFYKENRPTEKVQFFRLQNIQDIFHYIQIAFYQYLHSGHEFQLCE